MLGKPISILIPEHRAGEERRILDRVLSGERVERYETERKTKDGRLIVVSLTISPVRDARGSVVSASVVAHDITDRQRSIQLATRLQGLSAALGREITPQRAIDVLLEQAVGALEADAGAIGLLDRATGEIAIAGSAGYSEEGLAKWRSFPLDADVPMAAAIRGAEAVWTTTSAELVARFPALAGSEVRFEALAVIPLIVEGSALGVLSLSFARQRVFDPQERSFLLSAAQQAANTLERARLYETQRATLERLAFLAEASELLSGSLDPEAALRGLADLAVRRIADWCGIEMVDEEGRLRNVAVAHVDPQRIELAEDLRARYPVDPDGDRGVPQVIRSGRSELYEQVSDEMLAAGARDDEHLRLLRELGLRSVMIVPLQARGRALGAVTFVASESGTQFTRADLELAEDLARRAALAIDNSMLFRREHEAAVILQRSLLPESLPEVEGLEFAARYDPAAPGLEVGGDWYEVVSRADGTVTATIGDVAGRGIRAASVMGRVRPAMRAYVTAGGGPGEVIARLDTLMKEAERREMTTVFHLHLDPSRGTAQYVRAGHPPGLLRLADGTVEELSGAGTPPLGILDEIEYRTNTVEIPPGSLLLLYTDGLIERRDEDLDSGLARLKQVLAQAPGSAEECLAHLAEVFSADEIPDDVAMLAMVRT